MQKPLISYQTSFSGNIVLLSRFLRSKGFAIGPAEEAIALKALLAIPIGKEHFFKQALKALLPKNHHQYQQFDELYAEFWSQLAKAIDSKTKDLPEKQKNRSEIQGKEAQFEALKDWLNLSPSKDQKETASYSALEVLTKKNFQDLSEEEMRLMMSLLKKLARKLAHEKSRLRKKSKRKTRIDLRQTIRANMRTGGDIQQLVYSEKKERRLKLVLLCDVSRSMELYSRFFIHLIYAFQNAYDKIETFVFSTALHRVSEILNKHEFDEAFNIISERVPQWSGGTTIGSCLSDFTQKHAYSLVDKKTMFFILSDGWDTGAPEEMREAMSTIYKKAKKVIWLNPLAGSHNFAPEVLGMKTALPYIDVLASAHNLESLKTALLSAQKKRNLAHSQHFY